MIAHGVSPARPAATSLLAISRHIDHKSRSAANKPAPIGNILFGSPMGGNEQQRVRRSTMRQRNLCRRGRAQGRRHTRNNLERNVVGAQDLDLFAGAPEEHWVAAFPSDHAQPRSRQSNHQAIDFPLQNSLFPAAFTNVVNLWVDGISFKISGGTRSSCKTASALRGSQVSAATLNCVLDRNHSCE
jgi:hypothetical protein